MIQKRGNISKIIKQSWFRVLWYAKDKPALTHVLTMLQIENQPYFPENLQNFKKLASICSSAKNRPAGVPFEPGRPAWFICYHNQGVLCMLFRWSSINSAHFGAQVSLLVFQKYHKMLTYPC